MTVSLPTAGAGLIESLRAQVHSVFDEAVPRDAPVALIDFPRYDNPGDSAIWLGEVAALRRIGREVVYRADHFGYRERALRRRLGGGTILLQGGGSLGDVWPEMQRFREALVSAFPNNRIVQLPQTMHFVDRAALDRARRVFDGHRDLTLLVRDRASLAVAREHFAAAAALCPDAAFALGPLPRSRAPERDVTWLARTDTESAARESPPVETVDWLRSTGDRRAPWPVRGRTLAALACRLPRLARATSGWPVHSYDLLARERLRYAVGILSGARAIVTDRLHGHILSVLLGIPHVLLDNSYGKLSGFHATWTRDCELTSFADSPHEALELARTLASDGRCTSGTTQTEPTAVLAGS